MGNQPTTAPTQTGCDVTFTLQLRGHTVTDAASPQDDHEILDLHTSFHTAGDPNPVARHGVNAVSGDAAGSFYNPTVFERYNKAGTGTATLRVAFSDTAPGVPAEETFTVSVDTNGNLGGALIQAVYTLKDYATTWISGRKSTQLRQEGKL